MKNRDIYRIFGIKPKQIEKLKNMELIVDGKIETKITNKGIEQTLTVIPVNPVEFINVTIKI